MDDPEDQYPAPLPRALRGQGLNLYDMLGFTHAAGRRATIAELRGRFRWIANILHPDRQQQANYTGPPMPYTMQQLNALNDLLNSRSTRAGERHILDTLLRSTVENLPLWHPFTEDGARRAIGDPLVLGRTTRSGATTGSTGAAARSTTARPMPPPTPAAAPVPEPSVPFTPASTGPTAGYVPLFGERERRPYNLSTPVHARYESTGRAGTSTTDQPTGSPTPGSTADRPVDIGSDDDDDVDPGFADEEPTDRPVSIDSEEDSDPGVADEGPADQTPLSTLRTLAASPSGQRVVFAEIDSNDNGTGPRVLVTAGWDGNRASSNNRFRLQMVARDLNGQPVTGASMRGNSISWDTFMGRNPRFLGRFTGVNEHQLREFCRWLLDPTSNQRTRDEYSPSRGP